MKTQNDIANELILKEERVSYWEKYGEILSLSLVSTSLGRVRI